MKTIMIILLLSLPISTLASFSTKKQEHSFEFKSKLHFYMPPSATEPEVLKHLYILDRLEYLIEMGAASKDEKRKADISNRLNIMSRDSGFATKFYSNRLKEYRNALLALTSNINIKQSDLQGLAKKQIKFLIAAKRQTQDFSSLTLKPSSCKLGSVNSIDDQYFEVNYGCEVYIVVDKSKEFVSQNIKVNIPSNPISFYFDQFNQEQKEIISDWERNYDLNNKDKTDHAKFMRNIAEVYILNNWKSSLSSNKESGVCVERDNDAYQMHQMADIYNLGSENCTSEYRKNYIIEAEFNHDKAKSLGESSYRYPDYPIFFGDNKTVHKVNILYFLTGNQEGESMLQNTSAKGFIQNLVKRGYEFDTDLPALYSHSMDLKDIYGNAQLKPKDIVVSPFVAPLLLNLKKTVGNQIFSVTILNKGCINGVDDKFTNLGKDLSADKRERYLSKFCDKYNFKDLVKDFTEENSIIIFEGHAGYGDNIDGLFENKINYKEDDSKLLIIGGCDTYHYGAYNIPSFIKNNFSNSNIDIITTLGYALSSAEPVLSILGNFEVAASVYDQPMTKQQAYQISWQGIISNMDFTYNTAYGLRNDKSMYIANEIMDNTYQPVIKE